MTKRTFTTRDSKGCEFKVTAYYNGKYYDGEKFVTDADYYGMGLHSKTLKGLQESVGSLK